MSRLPSPTKFGGWLPLVTTDLKYTSPYWTPDEEINSHALERARSLVASPAAAEHLARYYATDSNYAGTTFTDLERNEPDAITAADLLAVTALPVEVGPHAIRTFDRSSDEISEKLRALNTELRLDTVDPAATAEAMASLYELVKSSLRRAGAWSSNAWVTASKICARKRPNLFPVRDNVVLDLLCLPKTYPVDWPAFQALVADQPMMRTLDDQVAEAAGREGVDVGDPSLRLRHLDVVLWMHAMNPLD